MMVRTTLSALAITSMFALSAQAGDTPSIEALEITERTLVAAYVPEDVKSERFTLASASPNPPASPSSPARPNWRPQSEMGIAKQGNIEFSIGGSGTNDEDFEVGSASATFNLGYFVADNLQVSIRQNAFYADNGESVWNGITRAALDFHVPFGSVVPFVGANVGYLYGESVDETFVAAPEVGVKWYLRDDAFIMGLIEYEFFFNDTDEIGDSFESGQFIYSIGIGLAF